MVHHKTKQKRLTAVTRALARGYRCLGGSSGTASNVDECRRGRAMQDGWAKASPCMEEGESKAWLHRDPSSLHRVLQEEGSVPRKLVDKS